MKIQYKSPHFLRLTGVLTLISILSFQALLLPTAYAGQITTRSLTLQANGLNGGSAPGVAVNHLFSFTLPTAGNVGSIMFQYCTTAADVGTDTCQAPPNMNAAAATLTGATGVNGMSISGATANSVLLTHGATPISISANTDATFQLSGVVNPQAKKADNVTDEPNYTYFVRISSYASLDGSGTAIDRGTVTASTAAPIYLSGTMPESLVFCTGATIPFKLTSEAPFVPTTIPDCANATSGTIKFNQLFDPTSTATSTSQMAASTNAGNGYAITVNGTTLTSGENTISALTTESFPVTGASQFGLNLKANDTTYLDAATGAEISPASVDSVGSNLRGEAFTGYSTLNKFRFISGEVVADSGYTASGPGTRIASDGQIYTVSYIANVPGSQPAGDYSTTLTYICTPTY